MTYSGGSLKFKNMKKRILTFGLISTVALAAMYVLMCLARQNGNSEISEILVYAGVVVLFTMVFVWIKSYRDNALGGFITFGKAFKVGILMSLASSLCYAIMWMILFNSIFKGFMEQHSVALMEKLKASGASVEEIAAKKEEMLKQAKLYGNPSSRVAIIFIQGFPVEAIMTLVASFVLKKKQPDVS